MGFFILIFIVLYLRLIVCLFVCLLRFIWKKKVEVRFYVNGNVFLSVGNREGDEKVILVECVRVSVFR